MKETEISVKTTFRSFALYLAFSMLLLVVLLTIKLLVQLEIFKHIEKKHEQKLLHNVRRLEQLRRKWYDINKDIIFITRCKKEQLTPPLAR